MNATTVHGISVGIGERCLSKNGMLLSSTRKDEAFSEFLDFLGSIRNQRSSLLIGHDARVFDAPILLRQLSTCELVLSRAMNTPRQPAIHQKRAGAIF